MKELERSDKDKTEISVKQKKQVEYELIGQLIPHNGHTIWEINKETGEIREAEFRKGLTFVFGQEPKKEILTVSGCVYISALNKKSALKKFKEGKSGSREISNDTIKLL